MSWDVPRPKPSAGRNPTVAETPSAAETVRGEDEPPIVTLELGQALHEHRLTASDELPGNIIVPTTNLNSVPVTTALQAVLTGTDVSLSWDSGSVSDRVVNVMNLSGPLPRVVEKICASAKVFCSYRNGSVELQDKETFIVSLPPIAKAVATSSGSSSGSSSSSSSSSASNVSGTNTMVETMSELLGSKVQLDEQGGNVIYTADFDGEGRISRYLEQLRNGRPLVVMQMYIWEVTLDKENAAGINWSKFKVPSFGPSIAKVALSATSAFTTSDQAAGSVSLGAVTTGKLDTSALITFLSTQGRVQTVSNPQITFVSGSSAEFKVGGKQRYISQVGQLIGTTNTSGTTNPNTTSGIGTNTISTDSIDTGLNIGVSGAFENGVVFANLDLSLTGITSLNPTTSDGVTIQLPTTTDEKINTVIRVRPGDNLVLAGLVSSKDNNSRQGIPLGSNDRLTTYGDDSVENRELVVVVKPSVVLFSDKAAVAEAKRKYESKPLPPEAVLIDKSGSQVVQMSATTAPTAAPTPAPVPDMAPTPTPVADLTPDNQAIARPPSDSLDPGMPTPLTPGNNRTPNTNAAVVDKRMMQTGFNSAFDELVQPPASTIASKYESQP